MRENEGFHSYFLNYPDQRSFKKNRQKTKYESMKRVDVHDLSIERSAGTRTYSAPKKRTDGGVRWVGRVKRGGDAGLGKAGATVNGRREMERVMGTVPIIQPVD